jgi:predicted AlkP superfamily pyrophosphatase or phosphodiesterase
VHNAARMRRLTLLVLLLVAACRGGNEATTPKRDAASAPARAKSSKPSTVVVVGIDGADWYVIRQLIREGQVPTIARLMANGAWGDFQTMAPTLSPAIWTTMATGYSPERHGISEFTTKIPDTETWTLVGSTERRAPAVWNLASDAGIPVGVVNWWATFPAEPVKGFVVSDRANLRRRFGYQTAFGLKDAGLSQVGKGETYPAELLPKILNLIGTNADLPPVAKQLAVDPMPADLQQEIAGHQTLVRDKRLSVLKFVMLQDHAASTATRVAIESAGAPRLLLVYFSGLDAAEHQFWAYYEPHRYEKPPSPELAKAMGHVIPAYYRYVDSLIAELLGRVPSDALVILVSDHGHDANVLWDPNAAIGDYAKWSMGNHGNAPPGILLFAGPGVQPGYLRRTTVYDLAPTLLALIGIPPSRDMPGRVITEAFTPEAREGLSRERVDRKAPPRSAHRPTAADIDPELLEKLRSLGYIR